MKKTILLCIGAVFVSLIVLFFSGAHGDRFAHPKIRVVTVDADNKPVEKVTIIFFEKMFEKKYVESPKEFIERLRKRGAIKETNVEGEAIVDARFGMAVHFFDLFGRHFFSSTTIFNDGVLMISKENYKKNKVLIDRKIYREKILNEDILQFKVVLEKQV